MGVVIDTKTVQQRGTGTPDYAQSQPLGQSPTGPVHTLTDVGEQAVRSGSPVIFDRRGNVVFMETFEGGVQRWVLTNASWNGNVFEHGGYSCQLTTSAPTYIANILRQMWPFDITTLCGMESSFSRGITGTSIEYYQMAFGYNDGTNLHQGIIDYDRLTQQLRLNDNGTVKGIVSNLLLLSGVTVFHKMKVVVDFTNLLYHRLLLDGIEYDISNFSLATTPGVAGLNILLYCYMSTATTVASGYVDTVIVTQNEPRQ